MTHREVLNAGRPPGRSAATVHVAPKQHERRLGDQIPGDKLTSQQVKALVAALKDIVTVLAEADPAGKTHLYEQLGVSLEYDPAGTVAVESQPRGVTVRVGGGT